MSDDDQLRRLGDTIWIRIPQLAARRFLSIGVALGDGAWLRAWPLAAVLGPVGALGIGGLLGLLRPDPTYSGSLAVLAAFVALAGVGAGIGAWAWVGYVVADMAFHWQNELFVRFGFGSDPLRTLWALYVPRLLTYLLLGVLLVMMPVIATGIRIQIVRLLHLQGDARLAGGAVLQAALFGTGVVLWAQATAFMIRPLWSFVSLVPDIEAISPLQDGAVKLALLGGVVAAVRTVIATRALEHEAPRSALGADRKPWPWPVGVGVRAGILTLLLSGVIAGTTQAVIVFVVMVAACAARALVLPRLHGYLALVDRVPLLIRLIVVGGVGWVLADIIVEPAVKRGEASFTWMLVAIVLTTVFAAALIPPAPASAPPEPSATAGGPEHPQVAGA
jgi:hypothetical protein